PCGVNELARARRALRSEQQQLPRDGHGIVILEDLSLVLQDKIGMAVRELAHDLEKYRHVAALVISGFHLGKLERRHTTFGEHCYYSHTSTDLLAEHYVIIWNRAADMLPTPVATLFQGAFALPITSIQL